MSYTLTVESVKLTPEQEIVASQNENHFKLILKTGPDENGRSIKIEGFEVEDGVIFKGTYITPKNKAVIFSFTKGASLKRHKINDRLSSSAR